MDGRIVNRAAEVRDPNETAARPNRAAFDRSGVAIVSFMGTPGAGKTSLLERALEQLRHELSIGVLDSGMRGHCDTDRVSRFDAATTELEADPASAGACHGGADVLGSTLPEASLDRLELLFTENLGNLVWSVGLNVREEARVMVMSVTECEETPLEHAQMFRDCDLVLINKVDLLPQLEFEFEEFLANLDAVCPDVPYVLTSARTGLGIEAWCRWLRELRLRELGSSKLGLRELGSGELALREPGSSELALREPADERCAFERAVSRA